MAKTQQRVVEGVTKAYLERMAKEQDKALERQGGEKGKTPQRGGVTNGTISQSKYMKSERC